MEPTSRIEIHDKLLDLQQPASIKVIKNNGKYQLILAIGLIAQEVSEEDDPNEDVINRFTDVIEKKELCIGGKACINLKKVNSSTNDPELTVAFTGQIDTKVPGTGERLLRQLDLNELMALMAPEWAENHH